MHIILKEIEFLEPISFLVRSHHKQVNGRGYSDGLKGEEIPYQNLNPASINGPLKSTSTSTSSSSIFNFSYR